MELHFEGGVTVGLALFAGVGGLYALLRFLNWRDHEPSHRGDYNDPQNVTDERFEDYPLSDGWGGGHAGPEQQYDAERRNRH